MKVQGENKYIKYCVKHIQIVQFIIIIILISTNSAWSFDTYQNEFIRPLSEISVNEKFSLTAKTPSSLIVDKCLPMLNSLRHIPSNSTMDRNQRPAGQITNLNFVFGVRFAFSSPHKTKPNIQNKSKVSFNIWQPQNAYAGNQQALLMSAYHQCQKEQALHALDSFRWIR
ncbi:MAG: hypothetical protein KAJ86_05100 [Alphaproteobacteria bacterium]|nr:hypothetical protein [Alphaproteobacteria bacterium]